MLACERRNRHREAAFARREAVHVRRHRPVEIEHDVAHDTHERRELLSAAERRGARIFAHARERERFGQQPVLADAAGLPAVAGEFGAHRPQRKLERDLVARGRIRDVDPVHAARESDEELALAQRKSVLRDAVDLDAAQRKRLRIAGYRQCDMRCRMRFERDADFIPARADFGLGDRGAARHAIRRLGQVRSQFVQQFVWRKCLRARRRGDRQRSEHDRAAECRRRSAWRNAHAATNEAHDQCGEQSDQHDAQHAHEPWRRDDQTHALRRQHGSAPAQHIARADIPAGLAGAGLHDGRFVVVADDVAAANVRAGDGDGLEFVFGGGFVSRAR